MRIATYIATHVQIIYNYLDTEGMLHEETPYYKIQNLQKNLATKAYPRDSGSKTAVLLQLIVCIQKD